MSQVLLEVRNINKSFGPTRALSDLSLQFCRGQVYGLVGENGSGKSTLSSIIAGIQPCDSGEMFKDGAPYQPTSAVDGQSKGVAMIVQEAGSIPNITIAENIFVGKEHLFRKGPLVRKSAMNAAARKALDNIGVTDIDPAASINALNQEDRKLVEIARAMYDDPDLLVVDETTTALSQRGRDVVYTLMERLRSENKTVIFISHDIAELMETCTSIVVLRDGVYVGRMEKSEMDGDHIKSMMVGREISGDYYRSDFDGRCDTPVVLRGEQLSGRGLQNVSLELHEGEILGIGGLTDSGMHELGRLLAAIDRPLQGQVTLGDGTVLRSMTQAVDRHIGYVSKNRDVEALLLTTSISNNVVLPSLRKLKRRGLVFQGPERVLAQEQVELLHIKCSGIDQDVGTLSGGNKQKVVFGKWIGNGSEILVLDCPTRGVDIGVKATMYQLMDQLKRQGKAIVMISEELPELIGMSDRILLMKDGAISGEYPRSAQLTEQILIHDMI